MTSRTPSPSNARPIDDLSMRGWPGVNLPRTKIVSPDMVKFLLWCILLVLCWPLALVAVILYPLVWLVLLPFRLVGIAVDGVLAALRGIVMLPARLVGGVH